MTDLTDDTSIGDLTGRRAELTNSPATAAKPHASPYDRLWALGYRKLTPIFPPDAPLSDDPKLRKLLDTPRDPRGKAPGICRRDGLWSGFKWTKHETAETDLARWHDMGAGVGIRTGTQSDGCFLAAIDADTLDPEFADLIRATVLQHFGPLPERIGCAPKALYLIRTTEPTPYVRFQFSRDPPGPAVAPERVEVLTEGRQFVAAGIHPKTREPYRWTSFLRPIDQLPVVTPDALDAFLDELRRALPNSAAMTATAAAGPVDQASLVGKPDVVRKAIEVLPNTSALFPDYLSYIEVGYALKAALPDDEALALELYQDWASRWDAGENDPDYVAVTFHSLKPPFRIGAGWLYRQVAEATGGGFNGMAMEAFEPVDDLAEITKPGARRGFKDLASFLGEYVPPTYAIEPIIRSGSLYTLTAKTGAGKTAFNVIAALAVAAGRQDVINREVEAGRVAYIAAENPDDIRMRFMIAAFRLGIDINEISARILVLDSRAKPGEIRAELAREAECAPFRLVIVDTLAATFDGDDFNNNKQVLDFMRRLRPLTQIAGLPSVLVSAHPIKNAAESALSPYGGGAILNEVDGNLTLWKDPGSGIVRLHWQGKLRGLEFEPIPFRFEFVGAPGILDAKGRQVQLPILRPCSEEIAEDRQRSDADADKAILRAMIEESGRSVRQYGDATGISKSTVDRRLRQLAKAKLVEQALGTWHITTKGRKACVE